MNTHFTLTKHSNIFFKRLLLGLAVILMGLQGLKAQTANNAYIFYNDTYGYLINDGGNPGVNTTFNKNAIWVASGALPNNGNTSRNIYSYLDINNNNKSTYLTRSGTSLGFANSASTYWRTSSNFLRYRQSNANNYYLKYTGTAFELNNTGTSGNLFTVTDITITENNSTPSTPTISITAASGLSNGGIQLTGNVTGSYVPTYYSATVRNQTYYWTTTTDATTTQPTGISDWSDATITWGVTTGGGYASVDGNGLVTITGSPTVNVLNGTVSGNVFGGGKGVLVDGNDHGKAGMVTGNPQVTIGENVSGHTAIIEGDVYGGGDAATVKGTPKIVVNDCNTQIGDLYGGGNAADVDSTNITINGGIINWAFGGGHGDKDASNPDKYADVKGDVKFVVKGGTIAKVFAGSNSKGDITGSSTLKINKDGSCAMKLGQVYGDGNEAAGNAGTITVGCTGAWTTAHNSHNNTNNRIGYELEGIGAVYGGANQANIGTSSAHSNITLNINSGMVDTVFGGNNTSGDIYGTIQVN